MAYLEELLNRLLLDIARAMDGLRAVVFKHTLSHSFFRRSYLDRPVRLVFLFCLLAVFHMVGVYYWPLFMSIIGPIALGIPHFVSVVRYTPMLATPDEIMPKEVLKKQRVILTGLIFFFGFIRYWISFSQNPFALMLKDTLWPEAVGAMTIFSLLVMNLRLHSQSKVQIRFLGFVMWMLTLFIIWKAPLLIMGVHTFIHNSLAFYFWYKLSATDKDRKAALLCCLIFHVIMLLMFVRVFDTPHVFDPGTLFNLNIKDLTSLLLFGFKDYMPAGDIERFGAGIVQLFVWGTNMHYYIWLKAIPDQFHEAKSSLSFRQGLQALWRDFGHGYIAMILLVFLGISVGSFFFGYWDVRMMYFALTAFHGFFELSGVAFLIIFKRSVS